MIPRDYITAWRVQAPWIQDFQVEQDLIISRALVEMFSHKLEELLGTKLRALYQRKKGRDLFDLATALRDTTVDPERIVAAFTEYMGRDGCPVTRALFEQNIEAKLRDPQFNADIGPLLAFGYRWDMEEAARTIVARLIRLLPGAPWKGSSP